MPFFFFYFPLSVCFLLFLQSESFAVVRAVFRRFETRARFSARTVFFLAVVVWLHLEKVRKQSYNLLYTEYQINCVLPFFFTRLCNLSRIMEVLMSSDVIGAIAGGCIAALIVLFFLVLVLRTLANRPEKAPGKASDLPQIDKDAAVRHLREAVRIPTVSMVEDYADNVQPFIDYRNWLENHFQNQGHRFFPQRRLLSQSHRRGSRACGRVGTSAFRRRAYGRRLHLRQRFARHEKPHDCFAGSRGIPSGTWQKVRT